MNDGDAPPRDERKFTPAAEAAAEAQRNAIRDELKTLPDHPWAGEYYHGDGLGVNVTMLLAPDAGFVFEWNGCLGLYDRNLGQVTQEDEHVFLHCLFANQRRGFQGLATSFRPVRWGERRYLIPDEQMIEFCNAVNSGTERDAASGRFLLRLRDDEPIGPAAGNPELPDAYARLLLDEEVRGTVTAVGKTITHTGAADIEFITTDVTLDIGTADGVFDGMELYVHQTEFIQSVIVTRAGESTSAAIVERIIDPKPHPKAGWKVSSRFHRD